MALPIYFAPLQGYTDVAYRTAHAAICSGVEAYCAPFLRLEHGEIRKRDLRDIEPQVGPKQPSFKVVPQVIAANVEEFRVLTAILIDRGYDAIDLNMGCPFPMQTRLGRGAGLLQKPDHVRTIMQEIGLFQERQVDNGKPRVRFSVKMRLGMNDAAEWQQILPILNQTPLTHITLHPRIGRQQYKGEPDWDAFCEFLSACSHPVIYNGDVETTDDIHRIEERVATHADAVLLGVMIGRGLLQRPTLAYEYQNNICLPDDVVRERILAIHERVLSHYAETLEGGDHQVLQKILPFWDYAGRLFDAHYVKKLRKARNLQDYRSFCREEWS